MPIDMSNYKMIYKDQVFNAISITPTFYMEDMSEQKQTPKVQFIEALFIDENGELKVIRDEAWCFKFVRR